MNDNSMAAYNPIRRIMAALDASTSSENALYTAVKLAALFNARVQGLFVEDINLLRLSQLPFAREISFYSDRPRNLSTTEMDLQLRVQADRIRAKLARVAEQYGVSWEFRSVRGAVGAEILSAGSNADLVVLGKIGRSLPGIQRSGSTVRTLLAHRRGMTLILQKRSESLRMPVIAVYDGSEASEKTIRIAAYLSRLHDTSMTVFIVANNEGTVDKFYKKIEKKLADTSIDVKFIKFIAPGNDLLADRIQKTGKGIVVIPCLEDWYTGEKLCGLVETIINPVLLIR